MIAAMTYAMLLSVHPAVALPQRQPLYVYCGPGDQQWVRNREPVDSAATIDAMFEWMAATYGVKRMYWRGEQDRMWLRYYKCGDARPQTYDFWTRWLQYLNEDVRTNDLAVAAARRNGMEIYIMEGLFEHGPQAEVGIIAPYLFEDRLRIEHPEWCPVDRWGERLCPGPIAFCYPEARRAIIARYVDHITRYGYDGIAFYTYVENFGIRYPDEFGFNEPIVQEFKRRHGVDIRTEPFDKEAWYKLRGEYVTQFFRELHAALAPLGKKIVVNIPPHNPYYAQPWGATRLDFSGVGMIYMDWPKWVEEGIVDELYVQDSSVGPPADQKAVLTRMLNVCKGRPVELTVRTAKPLDPMWQPFIQQGVTPVAVITLPRNGIERYTIEPTSVATLSSPDWRLRAQTLKDIAAHAGARGY